MNETQSLDQTASRGRAWKPIDVGGLRLYRVAADYPGHPKWNRDYIVAALSPRDAVHRVRLCYPEGPGTPQMDLMGFALNVLQPADWWTNGIPEPDEKDRWGQG